MSFAPANPAGGAPKKEKPPLHAFGEKVVATNLLTHIGLNSAQHSGIHTLDESTVLVATGNAAMFVNYTTGEVNALLGPENGGIGAVAVHPSKTRFAFCEKSFSGPRVVVCDYPSRAETHVMKNGALVGYAACAFNPDGKLLATVATEPDYIITVWNWEKQAIVLRNKAFSSDVFSVRFSAFSDTMLVTSGLGHLKVWDMASTFTGLKLQGSVGKFGKVEISDVTGHVALPDGKVLSGSEAGTLLLWEASLVKCELMRIDDTPQSANPSGAASLENTARSAISAAQMSANGSTDPTAAAAAGDEAAAAEAGANNDEDDAAGAGLGGFVGIPSVNGRPLLKCHEGNIEVVHLIDDNKIVMTAGHDGYVRYWSFSEIDNSEPSSFTHITGITLLKELFLGEGVKAKSVALSADKTHWVLFDEAGSIRTFPRWSYAYITSGTRASPAPEGQTEASGPLLEFFDGPIAAVVASPTDHSVVVGGSDGTVRLYDTPNKAELYRAAFDSAVSHLQFLPPSVDPSGLAIFAGFANGTVRVLRKCRDGFALLAAWRPHTAPLVAVAISQDASQVYTAAADGTVFYSKLHCSGEGATFEPEPYGWGWLPEKSVPTTAEWAAEGDVCFFGFANGMLLAVKPPAEKPNHDETFEFAVAFAGVGYRQKKKPPQKEKKVVFNPNDHQEESSSDEDEEDEDQGPWAVTAIRRLPQGGGYAVVMEKEELAYVYTLGIRYDDKLGPPPIPPTGVDPPGRVEEPGANIAFRGSLPIGVAVSQDGQSLLTAFSKGEVVVRRLEALADGKAPVPHARQFHDSVEGRVAGMALLFDNSALVTVGTDGLIVTHAIEGTAPPTGRVNLVALPKASSTTTATAACGKDEEAKKAAAIALSVEGQRRLEDKEAAEALAEGKRSVIKKKIAAVHAEYSAILAENDAASGGRRLSDEELTLDPELLRLLELEKINRVEEAAVEHSWAAAYKEQLLKQLRGAFVDTMVYDRFAVKSFDGTFSVASIRTPALTPAQQEKLAQLQQAIQQSLGIVAAPTQQQDGSVVAANGFSLGITLDDVPADSNANSGLIGSGDERNQDGLITPYGSPMSPGGAAQHAADGGAGTPNGYHSDDNNNNTTTAAQSTMNDTLGKNKSLKSQLDKAEERRRERMERKKGLEDLLARKPKPSDVDPLTEAEMRYAKAHMGDKILKTAPEYRVPTNLVPTAERKAKQLILLEHSINNLRAAFNEKLLALRDMKRAACTELNADRQRLAEIVAILGLDASAEGGLLPPRFGLARIEEPEKRFSISDAALRRWARARAKEQRRIEAQQRANKGFGADLAGGEDDAKGGANGSDSSDDSDLYDDDEDDDIDNGYRSGNNNNNARGTNANANKRVSRLSGGHRESTFNRKPSLLSLKEKLEMDLRVRLDNVRMGELEEEEAIIQRETLTYEKGRLLRRIEAAKRSFDEKLLEFLQERSRLEADICMADMRALLLFREFRMLLNFKKKDEALEAARDEKIAEQTRVNGRIKAISNDIEATRDRQLRISDGFAANRHDAETHIKTAFPLPDHPYLLEVFNRKIKRAKANDGNEDDDDAPTSSEDEEEDIAGDDFVEARPPTCDEAPWLHLLQLREGRLDLEDAQAALKQKFGEFEKLLTKVKDKERGKIEKELTESRKAIEDFQLEKQRQLNLLETIVVLKLSQIQCLSEDGHRKVPHDLQKAPVIVFTETAINGLRARIAELAEEKHELARKAEQLTRAKQGLLRRKAKRQLEHSEWEQRVNEVQLLKFGQKIDLEALENLAVDRETEELKQKLKMEEVKWERELRKQDNRVKSLKHDHQSRIGENTILLKDLGNVREEQQVLEHALTTSTQKIVGKMAGGSKVATAADRAQLKDLVVRQQQELDMLGNEITMLKRKGGHVYTPVIQRLQQQQQQMHGGDGGNIFSSTMPVGGGQQPQQYGMNASYAHPGGYTGAQQQQQQQPSSAPSGQQLANGLSGQRIGGGGAANSNVVSRPTLLSQSARGAAGGVKRPAASLAAKSSPASASGSSPSPGNEGPATPPGGEQ